MFPQATGQASGAWVRMSIEYARGHRYSLMLEGVFRDPAMTLAAARVFAMLGISVEHVVDLREVGLDLPGREPLRVMVSEKPSTRWVAWTRSSG
ncbi:hypothetical protein AAW14_36540 [Streptomyces hygroscopicus]|nr:hypothetical protein [Streptomyces hygroscopicus]MCW7947311.1 hypothetical protein [Streptomyces hygroscopicus]